MVDRFTEACQARMSKIDTKKCLSALSAPANAANHNRCSGSSSRIVAQARAYFRDRQARAYHFIGSWCSADSCASASPCRCFCHLVASRLSAEADCSLDRENKLHYHLEIRVVRFLSFSHPLRGDRSKQTVQQRLAGPVAGLTGAESKSWAPYLHEREQQHLLIGRTTAHVS